VGVKGTKRISTELSEKIFQVANREEVKDLTYKQIAEIVNKEYWEETGKASNIGESSVRKHGKVKRGSGYHSVGQPVHSMDDVISNLVANNLSLEGTESELRRRSSQATARKNLSPRTKIGVFLGQRATRSASPEIQETATRLYERYKSEPSYPKTKADFDEIDSLKLGSGYTSASGRPPPSTTLGRTFVETLEAGPVPEELKIFRSHQDIVNSKAKELFDLKIINADEYDSLRVSSGHGLPKAGRLWPQLRNTPSNVYLQPFRENLDVGPRVTQKDIYEFIRMNERMKRVHGTDVIETGKTKSGMKLIYAINKILRDNDLDEIPKETIKFFKDSPNVKSWKPSGKNVVNKQATAKDFVSGDVKRSIMNLLESPAGKFAIKSGKYALRGLGIAGIPLSAKAAVDYQKKDHPYLATVAGLSAIPGISLPMLGAELIGNIWNRDTERMANRDNIFESPFQKRRRERITGLLNN
tara:strand:- start:29 stop:1441 length:1413 start_codon:yes stop_codon:yes gene_type:complete